MAVKMIWDDAGITAIGTVVQMKPFLEEGDDQAAFSEWAIDGTVVAQTNSGMLYYSYATGAITATVTLYKDSAGVNDVATCSHNYGGGAVACTFTALHSSGITGRVLVANNKADDSTISDNKLTGVLVNGVIALPTASPTMGVGVINEASVTAGSEVGVCVSGNASVLMKSSTYAQKGNFAIADATTAGRATSSATVVATETFGQFVESCQPNADEVCLINVNFR
jgi:hypothetical protein